MMQLGKKLLLKHNGVIHKGSVIKIFPEDLDLQLEDGTIIRRKFWEVRTDPNEKTE